MMKELRFQNRSKRTRRQDHRERGGPVSRQGAREGARRPLPAVTGPSASPPGARPSAGPTGLVQGDSSPGQSGLGPRSAVVSGGPNAC